MGIIALLLSLGKWGTRGKRQAHVLSDLPSLPVRGSAKDILPNSLLRPQTDISSYLVARGAKDMKKRAQAKI